MVKCFRSLTLLFLSILCLQINAQERSVYGRVLDSTDHKGIESLIVQNKTSGQIVSTNAKGDFYIRAIKGDSIFITNLGYNRAGTIYDGKNQNPVILTKRQPIMLAEVVITEKRWKELQEEIDDFLENPQNEGALRKQILGNLLNTNTSQPGLGISIDGLYELWSKEGKLNRKVADLKYNDIKQFYIDLKYNPKTIIQITHIDEEDLEAFMSYCKPNENFILKASNYDLTYFILNCYKEFKYSRIYRKVR